MSLKTCIDCFQEKDSNSFSYEEGVCSTCNGIRWEKSIAQATGRSLHIITDSDTAGFAGYNEGIGEVVENRGHFNKLIKEKKLRPVG